MLQRYDAGSDGGGKLGTLLVYTGFAHDVQFIVVLNSKKSLVDYPLPIEEIKIGVVTHVSTAPGAILEILLPDWA